MRTIIDIDDDLLKEVMGKSGSKKRVVKLSQFGGRKIKKEIYREG